MFGFKQEQNVWNKWLHTTSAIPQGTERLLIGNAQGNFDLITNKIYTAPTLSIARLDDDRFDMSVTYVLSNGTWLLSDFSVDCADYAYVMYCNNHSVTYYSNINATLPVGTVKATIQRDLRYVDLSNIPTSYQVAKERLTVAPSLPDSNELVAQEIQFAGNKKYEVYSAPSKDSLRGSNGKAVVSTNSWIQVFGQEGDWILIQYSIDASHYRIGYITASALPRKASLPALDFHPVDAWVEDEISLTDDPFYSQNALDVLASEEQVSWLATIGDWAYIEVLHDKQIRGFVPLEKLRTDRFFDVSTISNGLASGNVRISCDGMLYCDIALTSSVQPLALVVIDDESTQLAVLHKQEWDTYENDDTILLSSATHSLHIAPLLVDGTVGEELFQIQW